MEKLGTKDSVIIETHTIFHTCLYMSTIKYVSDIPISLCNKKQARKAVQINKILISDAYHDYVLYEIERWYQIEYKKIHNVE